MSGKRVRTYYVSDEVWNDQPEAVARLLSRQTAEHPDDLWLIAIGPPDARAFLDDLMFQHGRVEDIEPEAAHRG